MSFELTEEMKAAYRDVTDMIHVADKVTRQEFALADIALHATAAALEAEHKNICQELHHTNCKSGNRSKADWLRLADEKLRGVKR